MTRAGGARLAGARAALGAACLAVTACGAAGAGDAERTVTVAGVREAPPPPRECPKLPSAPPPPKSVLDEPELDKEIVGLVRDALACDWGRMGFVYDCEGIRRFTSAWEPFRDGKGQKTLLRMLEDPSEKVRSLAAMRLNYLFESKDPEDVRRVLAVAKREKSAMVARDIGLVVGGIDVDATKTIEPLRELAKDHELYELRVGLASRLLDKNPRSHDALLLTVELTHDKNAEVATAAVGNVAAAKGMYKDEVCAALADAVRTGQDRFVGTAVESLADVGCPAF
ncbi:MAG TPA: hypothetical protein VL400_21050, partial [Polyangiaceae bacterium]|nr:hypothetical protein [Polyangiaceae bacterium]